MKITKLKIEGFGLFNEPVEFNFSSDKINLIIGNNETGKSTILKAITAALFGLDKSRWAVIKSHKPAEKYFTELCFNLKNTEFKIYRNHETNEVIYSKVNQQGIVENIFKGKASPQSRTEEKEFYYDALKSSIGINNQTIFNNINVLHQRSIEAKIDNEIQHILTGSVETNYKKAIEKWYNEYFDLTKTSVWEEISHKRNERKIELLNDELDKITRKKEAIMSDSIKSMELQEQLQEKEQKLKELQQETEKVKKEVDLTKNYIDYLKDKKGTEEKLMHHNTELEKFNKLRTELETNEKIIEENYSELKNLDDNQILKLKEKAGLYNDFNKAKHDTGKIKKESSTLSAKKIALGINGLVIAGLLYFLKLRYGHEYWLYAAMAAGLTALVYLGWTIFTSLSSKSKDSTFIKARELLIKDISSKISQLEKETKKLDITVDEKLFIKYEEYKKIRQKIDNLQYSLNTFENIENNLNKKQELEQNLLSINTAVKDLEKKNIGLTAIKDDFENTVNHVQQKIDTITEKEYRSEELKSSILEFNKKIAATLSESESTASLQYRIDEINEELYKAKNASQSYILAINTLNDAIREYQEKHIDRLSKNISHYYNKITKGKHKLVNLSDDFIPMIREDDLEIADNLSCGAEDQLYFAVRLALIKEINDLTHLPLLLDDPFINFDKPRLEVVKNILASVKEENQIILFTHFKSYAEWADINLIKL